MIYNILCCPRRLAPAIAHAYAKRRRCLKSSKVTKIGIEKQIFSTNNYHEVIKLESEFEAFSQSQTPNQHILSRIQLNFRSGKQQPQIDRTSVLNAITTMIDKLLAILYFITIQQHRLRPTPILQATTSERGTDKLYDNKISTDRTCTIFPRIFISLPYEADIFRYGNIAGRASHRLPLRGVSLKG